jgi:hypothetical protein
VWNVQDRLKSITGELFRRSVVGVFAHLSDDSSIYPTCRTGGAWPVAIGLAYRLEQDAMVNLTGDLRKIKSSTQMELQIHPPLAADQELSLVTTAALIAELYRGPGQWVLGLRRHRRVGNDMPWDGTLWNGSGITCIGLAAMLKRWLCDAVAEQADLPGTMELMTAPTEDETVRWGQMTYAAFHTYRKRKPKGNIGGSLDRYLWDPPPIP